MCKIFYFIILCNWICIHANSVTQIKLLKPLNLENIILHDGNLIILSDKVDLQVYGERLDKVKFIKITDESNMTLSKCEDSQYQTIPVYKYISSNVINIKFIKHKSVKKRQNFYFCILYNNGTDDIWSHQGSSLTIRFENPEFSFPLWASIILTIICYILAALFSGLNLGLMSLTPLELKIVMSTGDPQKKKYATSIYSLRLKGNIMLSAILIMNTITNAISTVTANDIIGNGVVAVVISTIMIVIFGEILPQSLFSRYALFLGCKTRYLSWFILIVTAPISYPIGLLLNLIFQNHQMTTYNREQLMEMLRIRCSESLGDEEISIIDGGLKLKEKTAGDIMNPLESCFMLEESEVLTYSTIKRINDSKFNRIPVYKNVRENVIGLIHVKDITFLDPTDNISIKNIVNVQNRNIIRIYSDVKLTNILREFKKGISHLGLVIDVQYPEIYDPTWKVLGLIALEDVIQEILEPYKEESNIENNKKHRGEKISWLKIKENNETMLSFKNSSTILPPQIIKSVCNFLSQAIPAFRNEYIDMENLRRLVSITENYVVYDAKESGTYIFKKGKPCNYFVLILDGYVEVQAGVENLSFTEGSFHYYGYASLKLVIDFCQGAYLNQPCQPFIPDFSVRTQGQVSILRIKASLYKSFIKTNSNISENKMLDTDFSTSITGSNFELRKQHHVSILDMDNQSSKNIIFIDEPRKPECNTE